MVQKIPICPDRIRKIPKQFSWLDHRLVRDGHIDRCSHQAAAIYLFLVTVADAQGMSYYSDRSICRRLAMKSKTLAMVRQELIHKGLIAYQKPLYQVLSLDTPKPMINTQARGQLQSLGQIFKQISKEVP